MNIGLFNRITVNIAPQPTESADAGSGVGTRRLRSRRSQRARHAGRQVTRRKGHSTRGHMQRDARRSGGLRAPQGLHAVHDHGERYLLCTQCVVKRADSVARGSTWLALIYLLGAAVVGVGLLGLASPFYIGARSGGDLQPIPLLLKLTEIRPEDLLSVIGVLTTLMIAVAVSTAQTGRQVAALEETAIQTNTLDMAKLDALRRNDTRMTAELIISLLCTAGSVIVGVAAALLGTPHGGLVALVSLACAVWAAFQIVNSQKTNVRATELRELLVQPIRAEVRLRIAEIRRASDGWLMVCLALFLTVTVSLLWIGGFFSSVIAGSGAVCVVISLNLLVYLAVTRAASDGITSSGVGRWAPSIVVASVFSILVPTFWLLQGSRYSEPWKITVFVVLLCVQIAIIWVLALGAAGIGPVKAVAKRWAGLPVGLAQADGPAHSYWHWVLLGALVTVVPTWVVCIEHGAAGLIVGAFLVLGFMVSAHLWAFSVFSHGGLRWMALLAAAGNLALQAVWVWGMPDVLMLRLSGSGPILLAGGIGTFLVTRNSRRLVSPLLASRGRREKSASPSAPAAKVSCSSPGCRNAARTGRES